MVALVLFFTGFFGLFSYSIRHVKTLKKINSLQNQTVIMSMQKTTIRPE
jgi:hypothetical protein